MRGSSLEWNFFSEVPPSSLSAAILMVSGRVWRIERVQWGHHQSFPCTSSPRRCWRRRRSNQMAIYCEREKTTANGPEKRAKPWVARSRPNIRVNMEKGFYRYDGVHDAEILFLPEKRMRMFTVPQDSELSSVRSAALKDYKTPIPSFVFMFLVAFRFWRRRP